MIWKFLFGQQKPLLDLSVDPLSRRRLRKPQTIQQPSGVIRARRHDLLDKIRLRFDVHDDEDRLWLGRRMRAVDEMGVPK